MDGASDTMDRQSVEMNHELFNIRAAHEGDFPAIHVISDDVALPRIEALAHTYVAVNDEDVLVGFIRIKFAELDSKAGRETARENPSCKESSGSIPVASQAAHVYPVAVLRSWQGYDVGTALVSHALERYGELRLVACTPSQGFYERLGFSKAIWESIAPEIVQDCAQCPETGTCAPQPFIKTR